MVDVVINVELYERLPYPCGNYSNAGAIVVILPPRSAVVLVKKLLQMDGVAGVLGDQETVDAFPGERGIFTVPQTEKWECSVPNVRTLVLAESLSVVSWQWILGAWRSGVRVLVTPELGGYWRVTSALRALITQVLVRSTRKLIQKVAFGKNWLSRLWWSGVTGSVKRTAASVQVQAIPGKILLVIGSLAAGGAERQIVHLANCLGLVGIGVSILVQRLSAVGDRFFLRDLHPGIKAFELPGLNEIGLCRSNAPRGTRGLPNFLDAPIFSMTFHPRFVDEVKRYYLVFLEERPEVVHIWLDSTSVTAGLAAILAGVPRIVLGGRNLAPYRFAFSQPYFLFLYRLLLSFSNVTMINNSYAGAVDYSKWLGLSHERMHVVYNGIHKFIDAPISEDVLNWQASAGLAGSGPVIGGVFRFCPEKEPIRWIDVATLTLQRWPEALPLPRFLLIGDGPLWEETVAYAHQKGIAGRIIFVKKEPRIALAMSSMDVFLLASRDEGTPNVLIEAQALGCPVVTTNAGGCAETVLDGQTGWVVKEAGSEALSERVIAVLQNNDWRMNVRSLAPDFVRNRFGNERLVSDMKRIYGME